MSTTSPRWDRAAIQAGAGVCITCAVPLQVIAALLGNDSGLATLLRVGALFGFLLGAGVAAWVQQRGLPLSHGLVTALATFAAVQAGFILVRALTGNDLRLGAAIANLAPVLGVGLFGGFLGQRLQRQGIQPSVVRAARGSATAGVIEPDDNGRNGL